MTYRKARDFADVVFGEAGKDTLTVRNGKRAVRLLLKASHLRRDRETDHLQDGMRGIFVKETMSKS
jgi:hypothetical protein